MADISTAVSMARVPILGENGRISDDYIPAAIGEGVESAEAAATRAESAATDAEGSASAASQSATQASGSASAANASATQAQQSATTAGGAATSAQSAQTAAEAAKAAAETAQSAAAGSAHDAQQSATAAQQSAASVADKFIASAQATTLEPGSQATASVADQVLTLGIPRGDKGDKGDQGDKGDPGDVSAVTAAEGSDLSVSTAEGTVTIDDSALRARIAELGNQAANVVTGTSTDLVAHGEDAYAQKPREVRIKGKTWVNRWPVLSGTHNGITVATDGTGLVTVTGTATADADVTADVSGWATGKSYTTMISATPTGCSAYFEVQKPSGNTSINATTTGATLNVASDATKCVAGVHVTSGTTVNASFRVMLVDGTEAPDCFTPPASITSVETGNLVTSGKNLLNLDGASVVSSGPYGIDLPNVVLQPGTYRITRPDSVEGVVAIYPAYDTSRVITSVGIPGTTFTIKSTESGIAIRAAEENVVTMDNVGLFQLEFGSTATAYEPPNVTTTPLPEVELRSLPNGTCDELVIKADGTCEVERRTAKIVLNGSEEQSTVGPFSAVHGGYYFNFELDMPDNGDGVKFSTTSQVSDKFKVGNADETSNTVGVYMNASTNKTDARISVDGIETVEGMRAYLQSNPVTLVYTTKDDSTEPQSSVTLPALPAPTFNQYHDSSVPSDTSTEYVRDINLVLANLESVQAALLGGE